MGKLADFLGKGEPSAAEGALKGLVRFIGVSVILTVVGFSDVMYIVVMQRIFPPGLLLVVCYIGAGTGFLATIYLLIGKTAVFMPGGQILISWIAFGAELLLAALNIILAFSSDRTGVLGAWSSIAPATPVIHMLFVALIFFCDPSVKQKHKDMEMQWKIAESSRQVEQARQLAKIAVERKHLEFTVQQLGNAITSPESLARIEEHASEMNDTLLTELTGKALSPPSPKNDNPYGGYGARRK